MTIKTLEVGQLKTNCYLVTDEETKEALIVDPGDEADFITTTILENKLIPIGLLLTHGHYDHCLGVLELKLNFQTPTYLHRADLFLYQNAHNSAKHFSNTIIPPLPPIDHLIVDNQTIPFGDSSLQVIHTPGHTPGSCCFLSRTNHQPPRTSHLFTGDTFFASGVGSTDHKYSSKSDLQKSLKRISEICHLTSDIYLYPGHENNGFTPTDDIIPS